jgi:ABC-type branched-subunit amino acid transport system substrate-binding protein
VTADSIKIGLVVPDTGPGVIVNDFNGARSAVETRIAVQNARGGVAGRKIKLEWRDDQATPTGFSLATRDLVSQEQVFGLVALTVAFNGAADWLAAERVPVAGFASGAEWSDYPNVFHFGNLFNKGTVSTFGDYVKAAGGTRAVVVVDPIAAASPSLITTISASLRSRGVQIVDQIDFTHGISSPARVVDDFESSGADTLIGSAVTSDFVDIYSQVKDLGGQINVALNAGGYSSSMLSAFGSKMAGMTTLTKFATPGSAAMRAYEDAMRTYSPELADPSDEIAVASYVATDEMIRGLELAGPCPTRDAFIHNLRGVTDFTGGGLMPPVDLSKPKEPVLCSNFVKPDAAGRAFVAVPPPAELQHDGYWCGQLISD